MDGTSFHVSCTCVLNRQRVEDQAVRDRFTAECVLRGSGRPVERTGESNCVLSFRENTFKTRVVINDDKTRIMDARQRTIMHEE